MTHHKKVKGLKNHNLRDHMSEAELIFTALAELSTRQIADNVKATGFDENKAPAKKKAVGLLKMPDRHWKTKRVIKWLMIVTF